MSLSFKYLYSICTLYEQKYKGTLLCKLEKTNKHEAEKCNHVLQ